MFHRLRLVVLKVINKTPFEATARRVYSFLIKTKGNAYDKQTFALMRAVLSNDSNYVDVGAYRGEILREILKVAPDGQHFAFEPVPENYQFLVNQFPKVNTYNLALSESKGIAKFQHVLGREARSGLLKVKYPDKNQEVIELNVKIDTLDNIISEHTTIDFIKIDVEGAELDVLKGAQRIIRRDKPFIVFEHDEKAKEYKTSSEEIYDLLEELELSLFLIKDYLESRPKLNRATFKRLVDTAEETFFLACV